MSSTAWHSVSAAAYLLLVHHCLQCDAVEVAYLACLLEEQHAWPRSAYAAPRSSSPTTRSSAPGTPGPQEADAEAATEPAQQPKQQQPRQAQQLTLCTAQKLPEAVLAAMALRLRQELLHPADPAAAATAHVQVGKALATAPQASSVTSDCRI